MSDAIDPYKGQDEWDRAEREATSIDKALNDFVAGEVSEEMEGAEKIGDALREEVSTLIERAREGDEAARSEIVRRYVGRRPEDYVPAVMDLAGIDINANFAHLFSGDMQLTAGAAPILEWAEAVVLRGETPEPNREVFHRFETLLWHTRGGRRGETYQLYEMPRALPAQERVVRWLTWLGFDVRHTNQRHESVSATELTIDVEPGSLTQEARRLQVLLWVRLVPGQRVKARYEPHGSAGQDVSIITLMVSDDDFPLSWPKS